jgi:hypothetical protein
LGLREGWLDVKGSKYFEENLSALLFRQNQVVESENESDVSYIK